MIERVFSSEIGSQKLGQPDPESNFESGGNLFIRGFWENAVFYFEVLTTWFLPAQLPFGLRSLILILLFCSLFLVVISYLKPPQIQFGKLSHKKKYFLSLLVLTGIYLTIMLLLRASMVVDIERFLSLIYPLVFVLLFCVLDAIFQKNKHKHFKKIMSYNFDGYGVSDIDGDMRPMHAAPDISGFDNMFLYKAIREQFPEVSLERIIIEGRSNGGSAMIAMASDYNIWPQHMRDFWSRNLPSTPTPEPDVEIIAGLSLQEVVNNPVLSTAFNNLLSNYSEQDLLDVIENGQSFALASNDQILIGSAGEQVIPNEPEVNENGVFIPSEFVTKLSEFISGDFFILNNIKETFCL